MIIFQLLLLVINIFYGLLFPNLYENAIFCFWSYLIIILLEVISEKRVTLLIVFLSAFVYIVLPEGVLKADELYNVWGKRNVTTAWSFFVISSTLVFIGYKLSYLVNKNIHRLKSFKKNLFIIKKRKFLYRALLIFTLLFFLINIENTIYGLFMGRASAFPYFFSNALYAMSYIVIGLWHKYHGDNLLKATIYSLPILVTLLATGTRFLLLYVIFILLFKDIYYLSFRKIAKLTLALFVIFFTISIVKTSRVRGLSNFSFETKNQNYTSLSEYVLSKGSQEGLIRNIAMINDYTQFNSHTYGKSIGFLGIFWVPRTLWSDKPVMLDSWLVREYLSGFSDGYSTASGYGGELFMDFGFTVSLIILTVLGFYLYKLDKWIYLNHNKSFKNYILSGFLFGWLFFAVRSILTSTFILFYMLVFINVIFKHLKKYKIIEEITSDE